MTSWLSGKRDGETAAASYIYIVTYVYVYVCMYVCMCMYMHHALYSIIIIGEEKKV